MGATDSRTRFPRRRTEGVDEETRGRVDEISRSRMLRNATGRGATRTFAPYKALFSRDSPRLANTNIPERFRVSDPTPVAKRSSFFRETVRNNTPRNECQTAAETRPEVAQRRFRWQKVGYRRWDCVRPLEGGPGRVLQSEQYARLRMCASHIVVA